MATYIGLIRLCEGRFTVTFPEFPNLCLATETSTSVRLGAQMLLQRHIIEMRQRNEVPPAPMPIRRVFGDPCNWDAIPVLIRVVPSLGARAAGLLASPPAAERH